MLTSGREAPVLTGFTQRVLATTVGIPAGRVMTYGEVARRAGRPRAARAVGNILAANPRPFFGLGARVPGRVPCHRVVRADGRVGGYSGPRGFKERLLQGEGVRVAVGRVDERYMFRYNAGTSR